ncbi:MAG: helix-turn-helix domain-containing protein [Chloroflexota bacterium]
MTTDPLSDLLDAAMSATRLRAGTALEPLAAYDRRHNADLLRTLATYLAHGCNATRSAEALYLHRSGLLYRLARIEALLGTSLIPFRVRVALELAVLSLASLETHVEE